MTKTYRRGLSICYPTFTLNLLMSTRSDWIAPPTPCSETLPASMDLPFVTQDADFSEMSEFLGFPPKVIWIRRGNCSTSEIEITLRLHQDAIARLDEDPATGILTIL